MKRNQQRILFVATLCTIVSVTALFAQGRPRAVAHQHNAARYRITVSNLTPGQPFSPALIVTHSDGFDLFEAGETASAGIALIAEEGDASVAMTAALESSSVADALVAGSGPFFLGSSVSGEVSGVWPHAYLSIAGMLGSTNDAFYGLDSFALPRLNLNERVVLYLPAYDAGSEHNSESCASIPGPPCGNPGMRETDGAEGLIAVHSGIHGVGDLDPSVLDWRNPVAKVTIERAQ